MRSVQFSLLFAGSLLIALFSGCYTFKDVNIDPRVKTARVNYIENKARYINPQLSPQLSEKLRQKVNNQTRLTLVQSDDAHYDISGYVSDYSVTTSGISQQNNQSQASMNRLTVTVTIIFKNNIDPTKNFESPVSRSFEFSSGLSLQQAEAQLTETIIQNLTDEIFNKIFSNW